MSKHTPGPWKAITDNGKLWWIRTEDNLSSIASLIGQKEIVQNARLIAAAPELLETLKDCLDDERIANGYDSGSLAPETIVKAKAAIAKAEGSDR